MSIKPPALPFYATQIINPYHYSIISAIHEKGEEYQLIHREILIPLIISLV